MSIDGTPNRDDAVSRRSAVSISWALAIALGAVSIAGAAALVFALQVGRQNTVELVRDRTETIIGQIVERTRLHLDPVRAQSDFVARLIESGELDPAEKTDLGRQLTSALAATPQVEALSYIDTDLMQLRIERQEVGSNIRTFDMFDTPGVREALAEAEQAGSPNWGELVWSNRFQQPLVNLRTPIVSKGNFAGVLFATVTVAELSDFLARSNSRANSSTFILYGREDVVAHKGLVNKLPDLGHDRPLPAIGDIGDPVLAAIWNPGRQQGMAPLLTSGSRGHVVSVEGIEYVFVYQTLEGFSDRPWLIGSYFPLDDLAVEVQRLVRAAWVGFAVFLAAALIAWFTGRAIGRPVRRLAEATSAIRSLDLENAHPLDHGRFREINEAADAYNSLLSALRWFETYVPKRLVLRLMAHEEQATMLEQRNVTVMFTDIVGFTPFAESLTAQELAQFLNEHFELITECVEAEGGTVDKYIGDAVMAFWGAPERQSDQVDRACRSVKVIVNKLSEENTCRRAKGLLPIRIRIGVHTGPVVVGNIGASGRINYTVIGDTVNIAQRLEGLAGEYLTASTDVVALASREAIDLLADPDGFTSIGEQKLKGRRESVDVYRLH